MGEREGRGVPIYLPYTCVACFVTWFFVRFGVVLHSVLVFRVYSGKLCVIQSRAAILKTSSNK